MPQPSITRFPTRARATVLECIKLGAFPDIACAVAKVEEEELRDWLARGQTDTTGTYRKFYQSYIQALAEYELALMRKIQSEDKDDKSRWRCYVWLLEHRFPERWSGAMKSAFPNGQEEENEREAMEEELRRRLARIAERGGAGAMAEIAGDGAPADAAG